MFIFLTGKKETRQDIKGKPNKEKHATTSRVLSRADLKGRNKCFLFYAWGKDERKINSNICSKLIRYSMNKCMAKSAGVPASNGMNN